MLNLRKIVQEFSSNINWFKWWFSGYRSLIVSPFAVLLIIYFFYSIYLGVIQTIAYFAVVGAVWSKIAWVGVFIFVTPFSLLLGPFLYGGCLLSLPKSMQNETKSKMHGALTFIITIAITYTIVSLFQTLHGNVIGWIADIDPDAAFEVGITGSIPPSHLLEDE